jgi:hypothetical protein
MKPRSLLILAIIAAATAISAIVTYSSRNQWDYGSINGLRLVPALATGSAIVGTIAVAQGEDAIVIESKDGRWTLKERDGYPADGDKVRSFLIKLTSAELIEAKTRKTDRYRLLDLDDPVAKTARGKSVKLMDNRGKVVADIVVGKRRPDAFGTGKGGTYVRMVEDPQSWLANAELDLPTDFKSWIKTNVLDTDADKIGKLEVSIPGEEPLRIDRGDGASGRPAFVGFPEGTKFKDQFAADTILRAASSIDIEDVRRFGLPAEHSNGGTITFAMRDGLEITLRLRKDGDVSWLSIAATGSGDAQSAADTLNARTAGWEFKIPTTRADTLLKRRSELIENS